MYNMMYDIIRDMGRRDKFSQVSIKAVADLVPHKLLETALNGLVHIGEMEPATADM